jgi:hypothetical protein
LAPEIGRLDLPQTCDRYDVVPAERTHARDLAPIMRAADRDEIWAAAALSPLDGLVVSLNCSLAAWCWRVEGQPACLFGVSSESVLSGVGMPWLLSSDLVERRQLEFLRHYRPFLGEMLTLFPILRNWVDARYALSIRWLRWMGFALHPAEPYGPFGMPFHRFEMRRT